MRRMQLHETLEYDAPPDRVFAMLCDRSWRERVCQETKAVRWTVAIRATSDSAEISVVRVLPARVPDLMKAMVGDTIETSQDERWGPAAANGSRRATMTVQVTGQPATVTGEVRLEPNGSGTRQTISGDISVSIPFIGRRIEAVIGEGIRAAVVVEQRLGQAYLAT